MGVLAIQRLIAAVFVVLGGWALVHPASVIALCLRPEFRGGAGMGFAVGCFGAQALIAGLFAATARFTRATFAAYGAMLVGFLLFDWWFYAVEPVLTPLGAGSTPPAMSQCCCCAPRDGAALLG